MQLYDSIVYIGNRLVIFQSYRIFMEVFETEKKDIIQYLMSIRLFLHLPEEKIKQIAHHCTKIAIDTGEILMKIGDIPDYLYIVLEGKLNAYQFDKKEQRIHIGDISMGDVVGEMGVLTHSPRSATIEAVIPTSLLRISNESIQELTKSFPDIILNISLESIKRSRKPMTYMDIIDTTYRPRNSYIFEYLSSMFILAGTVASTFPHPSMFVLNLIGNALVIIMALYFRAWAFITTRVIFVIINVYALYRIYLGLWAT